MTEVEVEADNDHARAWVKTMSRALYYLAGLTLAGVLFILLVIFI
jgi:hypothetical protein